MTPLYEPGDGGGLAGSRWADERYRAAARQHGRAMYRIEAALVAGPGRRVGDGCIPKMIFAQRAQRVETRALPIFDQDGPMAWVAMKVSAGVGLELMVARLSIVELL